MNIQYDHLRSAGSHNAGRTESKLLVPRAYVFSTVDQTIAIGEEKVHLSLKLWSA
jgi:hypothetical protein